MAYRTTDDPAAGYGYQEDETGAAYKDQQSPNVIVPLLLELLQPATALDVGCGIGLWTKELLARDVDAIGIDTDWVPEKNLMIPRERFLVRNLAEPLRLEKKFDLALCLEVAEHLPPDSGEILLDSLVAAAPIICFSAAIPGQGGYRHINERYQDYWLERFARRGYEAYDLVRPKIWTNPNVRYYYAQNILVYARSGAIDGSSIRRNEQPLMANVVHPQLYERRRAPENYSLRSILRLLPYYLMRGIKARSLGQNLRGQGGTEPKS
jgi:SAM-dependent methyltransferase